MRYWCIYLHPYLEPQSKDINVKLVLIQLPQFSIAANYGTVLITSLHTIHYTTVVPSG